MSDPIPVRISQLPSTTLLNDSDDLVLVQSGATVRVSLANLTTQTAPNNGDDYLLIRSNQLYKIDSSNLPISGIVGELRIVPGNVIPTTEAFPFLCLTNFNRVTNVENSNWPDLVPWLRSQQVIYLEGLVGETSAYSANVSGSTITLDDNAANNALLAALQEDLAATGLTFTNWRSIGINSVVFEIASLNTTTREITVSGSPATGVQNIIVYQHQIAGSITAARIHDLRGKAIMGGNSVGTISGLNRRDAMQGHRHGIIRPDEIGELALDAKGGIGTSQASYVLGDFTPDIGNGLRVGDPRNDGVNGDPRTDGTTHGPDISGHIYMYGGRYVP